MRRSDHYRIARLLGAAIALAAVVGCTATPLPATTAGFTVTLAAFTTVPAGALAIAAPDDGTGRLFVVIQTGQIVVVNRDGTVRQDPLVDLQPLAKSGGEQGLLGIALHPSFPTDPRIFVDYTNTDGDTVVASLTIDPADPNRADPAGVDQLLLVRQPFANHNGGALAFGPDGFLYVSFGDGGSGGDPQGNGQNTQALLGKILRLDIDVAGTARPFAIPAGNPFAKGGGAAEVWLYGLRNPWRMSFDRSTGDLWIGDVGQAAWEEVDVARAGVGGLNFGWNRMEGSHCYNAPLCQKDGLALPVSDYGRDVGSTVIGGYVYRGGASSIAVGSYLFADYGSGRIFAIRADATAFVAPITVGGGKPSEMSAFGEDAAGELFVTGLSGTVSRVVITAN